MGNSAIKTDIIEVEEGTDSFKIVRCPDGRPASDILKRLIAEFIDFIIISVIFLPSQAVTLSFARIFFETTNFIPEQFSDIFEATIFFITYSLVKGSYYYFLYRQKCTTLGKKFFHFRVYRTNTQEPIGILRILLREYIGKTISFIIFPFSIIWYFFDNKSRFPHDFLGGTMVVEELKEHNGIDY